MTEVWECEADLDRHNEALVPVLLKVFGESPDELSPVETTSHRVVGIHRPAERPLKVQD